MVKLVSKHICVHKKAVCKYKCFLPATNFMVVVRTIPYMDRRHIWGLWLKYESSAKHSLYNTIPQVMLKDPELHYCSKSSHDSDNDKIGALESCIDTEL